MRTFLFWAMLALAPLYAQKIAQNVAQDTVELHVDATGAATRVIHVRMSMPARPGPRQRLFERRVPAAQGLIEPP